MRISVIIAVVASLSVTRSADNPPSVCREKADMHAGLGNSTIVNCPYLPSEKNQTKRFCRKGEGAACANIISAHRLEQVKLDRFSLTVDTQRSVYTVNMSKLTGSDTGTYRCFLDNMERDTVECLKEYQLFILYSSKVVTSIIGDNVRIQCDCQASNDDEKCLCKGESPFECKNITKETDVKKYEFPRSSGRRNGFPVWIKNVAIADSGTYWCCTTATHGQSKITLVVEKPNSGRRGGEPMGSPEWSSSTQSSTTAQTKTQINKVAGVIVSMATFLVFLALTVVALILCKHNRKRGGFSEEGRHAGINTEQENPGGPHYEEIHPEPKQANPGNHIPSVYATASLPADQPHYASIRFRHDPSADVTNEEPLGTNKEEPSNTHTAEPTVYSTLKKSEEASGTTVVSYIKCEEGLSNF